MTQLYVAESMAYKSAEGSQYHMPHVYMTTQHSSAQIELGLIFVEGVNYSMCSKVKSTSHKETCCGRNKLPYK